MQTDFKLYKVDMKYIRNLHNIDDKVLSVSPQAGKNNRVFVGIVIICGIHKYCIPLSSPKEKHKNMKNSMDFSKNENGLIVGVLFGLTDYAYWLYVTDLGVDRDYEGKGIGRKNADSSFTN